MSSLAERIAELTADMKRGWQAQLARACGIKPPSVAAWLSGETKSIDGNNLLVAASFFHVQPKWLQSGVGQKSADGTPQQDAAPGPVAPVDPPDVLTALTILGAAIESMDDPDARKGAVGMLHTYIDNPDGNGDMVDLIARRLAGEMPAVEQARRTGSC